MFLFLNIFYLLISYDQREMLQEFILLFLLQFPSFFKAAHWSYSSSQLEDE